MFASPTGSFDHGVRRNSCAFSLQVLALPLSETRVPNDGLAKTFTHGAGVMCPDAIVMTYSRSIRSEPAEPVAKDEVALW